ncbi:FecR family protein [Pseudoflavitalea rhizosphaerae]|uniref:FecR family protein n=1 Tax=Pseudoflavitalea rhizosphaerae TaxID=1884793 RepID=UPI000F8D1023|nr:FecR family protein [Pseudoflavitalea rhizosphaerae]
MNQHSTSFLSLLTGYLTDGLSAEQHSGFMQQLQEPGNQQLLEQAIDALAAEKAFNDTGNAALKARSLQRLLQQINATPEKQKATIRSMNKRWMAAAAIAVLVAAGAWLWFSQHPADKKNVTITASKTGNDLEPGKDGAILVLADGRKVLLDSMPNGTVAQEKGAELILSNGTLQYNVNDLPVAARGFNTVSTPRGRQIQLNLPDGTRAWLNAGSSLHFPTAFSGPDRKVEMTGEVFFEVAKDAAHPFIVKMNNSTSVEVLGTSFNVNAYVNEPAISTTLAEGTVKMVYGQQAITLKPGQQGFTANAALKMKEVDVSEITAWKEGRFELYGNIKDIMRQLQRWYNINEVDYQGGTENRMLVATIARSKKLSEVLAILERTGSVNFSIEGEKVIVKP